MRFEITKNNNDWCFEFTIFLDNYRLFRFKLYDKTAEKNASKGVKNKKTLDPLA